MEKIGSPCVPAAPTCGVRRRYLLELIERNGSGVPAIPNSATRRRAPRLLPPIQMGGCGCCNGRGDACMSANVSTVLQKLTFSCVHSVLINRRHSSLNAPRSAKGTRKAQTPVPSSLRRRRKAGGRPRADRWWLTSSPPQWGCEGQNDDASAVFHPCGDGRNIV